ncbi:MAG TPA: hypothetical protein VGR61_09955 [Candidatus Dormibacteraeota bacterium]|nr:hypothetical protein [Candidatus Dormibacteraeota bacterium]
MPIKSTGPVKRQPRIPRHPLMVVFAVLALVVVIAGGIAYAVAGPGHPARHCQGVAVGTARC